MDDMGDGSLPGKNSLRLIVKGGERERARASDRRRGGERRQACGFHDARFGPTCTCLVCVCARHLEDAVIHIGVVSETGVVFFFAASYACPCSLSVCVYVCVCWPGRRQGVVQLYYHPPTLPPRSLRPCVPVRTMWGVKRRGRESEGGEAEEK